MTTKERIIEILKNNIEVHAVDNGEFIETTINFEELADALLKDAVILPYAKERNSQS